MTKGPFFAILIPLGLGCLLRSVLANFAGSLTPPRGSERDSAEELAFHLLLLDPMGKAVACGTLHLNNPGEAQVTYLAVDEAVRGRGYGGRILLALGSGAASAKSLKIVLKPEKTSCDSTFGTTTQRPVKLRRFWGWLVIGG
jgi:hypothetical protein